MDAKFAKADLRGADLGEPDDGELRYLKGAVISHAQAAALLAARGLTVV